MLDCAALTGQSQFPQGTLSRTQFTASRNQPALTSCSSAAWISSIIVSLSTRASFSNAPLSMCAGSPPCRAFFASSLSLS